MPIVNVEDLQPGMLLLDDAVHLNGRILLRKDTVLTEKHIKVFKTWGLTEANIEGADKEEITSQSVSHIDPALLKQAQQEVHRHFIHTDLTHPAMAELFRLRVRDIAKLMTGK